jgi:cbb3-type cytochrome c oxidase subunit III
VQLRGLAGACAVLIAAIAASGCGTTGLPEAGSGDASSGREIFKAKCGQCHTLADAGTQGRIGPNLDDAFRQSRVDGLGDRTIQSVVRDQIAYPVEHPTTGAPGMPADIVTGDDANSVAFYVASVAGLPVRPQPGAEPGGAGGNAGGSAGGAAPDGKAIFAEAGCASCHTLKAAGASGTVGPNLDEAKPPKELVIDRVTNGKGVMPSFKDSYSAEQIAAVADYVSKNAGQ